MLFHRLTSKQLQFLSFFSSSFSLHSFTARRIFTVMSLILYVCGIAISFDLSGRESRRPVSTALE